MKRLAFLLAMSSGLLTARADADSLLLLHALSGDENAWFETLAASAPSAISDSVWQVFASPPSERPPWGQVGDEALWMLAHWTAASHADFIEQHRMVEQNGSQQFPLPDRPDRDWLLLFALLGGVAAIGATAWAWHTMRVRLLPLPEHLQPLEAVLQGHETERSRAISLWRATLRAFMAP